jgi:hypothetical protein
MTFIGVVTVIGVLFTIYKALPLSIKLEFKLILDYRLFFIIIIGYFSFLYLQFYSNLKVMGLTPQFDSKIWYITPQQSSYLVLLIFSIFIYIYFKNAQITRGNIWKFRELSEQLLRSDNHKELITLIEKHLTKYYKILKADFFLSRVKLKFSKQQHIINIIEGIKSKDSNKVNNSKSNIKDRFSSFFKKIGENISDLLPSYEREQACAQEFFNVIILSDNFIKSIINHNPYFALKLFDPQSFEQFDFIEKVLWEMMDNRNSVLYDEIKNNENTLKSYTYAVPQENKLIYYLFYDPNEAKKLGVWKPIGDYLIKKLDIIARDSEHDLYNLPMDDFLEKDKWESPMFVGIFFFDIMVSRAIFKSVEGSFWIYYYSLITQKIVRNYSSDSDLIEQSDEFPTKYHYLLYEIISTLRNWIRSVNEFDTTSEDNFENLSLFISHPNIHKDSMVVLGQCLNHIVEAEKFESKFIFYMLGIVFDLYFEIKNNIYAEAFIKIIIAKGDIHFSNNDETYLHKIKVCYEQYDRIPYMRYPVYDKRHEKALALLKTN